MGSTPSEEIKRCIVCSRFPSARSVFDNSVWRKLSKTLYTQRIMFISTALILQYTGKEYRSFRRSSISYKIELELWNTNVRKSENDSKAVFWSCSIRKQIRSVLGRDTTISLDLEGDDMTFQHIARHCSNVYYYRGCPKAPKILTMPVAIKPAAKNKPETSPEVRNASGSMAVATMAIIAPPAKPSIAAVLWFRRWW